MAMPGTLTGCRPASLAVFLAGDATPHVLEDLVSTVLQRHVQVVAHVVALGHHVQHIHGEPAREGVVQSNPVDALRHRSVHPPVRPSRRSL